MFRGRTFFKAILVTNFIFAVCKVSRSADPGREIRPPAASADSGQSARIALVIGNDAYHSESLGTLRRAVAPRTR